MARFADTGPDTLGETCYQAKKRRAEALDGIAGDIGDVCRARLSQKILLTNLDFIHPQTHMGGHDHSLLNNSWLC